MNKIYLLSFSLLFLTIQPALADMNAANDALARGDHAAAAAEFQKLAEQGDKKAQAHLGYMYYVGEGVEQDNVKAVKWYKKAAILGDKDSQYNLAVAYAFGEGVKQSYKEAFHWYRRAAEQNHTIAQYSLGVSYAYGEGIEQNPELAAEWFEKSAVQGYERAQVLLGSLYHTGDGIEKDYEKAAFWYRKAADKGNAAAQYNLGNLYRAGNGVQQDYNQAVRWFRLSADQGYAAAQNELASIERAIAGANRPAPASVPDTETTPVQTQDVEKTTDSIPTLAKTEPSDSVTTTAEEEAEPAPVAETKNADASVAEKPKRGFFSKLFGKKDTESSKPDQSGVVYATPEEITEAENSKYATVPGTEMPEEIISQDIVPAEPEVAEVEEIPEPEPIGSPTPDANEPDLNETVTAVEEEPKRGFFSKLFGKKESVDAAPDQSGVVYATPEEITEAENSKYATVPETETPEEIISQDIVPAEPEVAEVEEIAEPKAIESPAADTNESDMSEAVATAEEEPKRGFFSKLFGKKDSVDTTPEEISAAENTDQSIDETSEVITYAADSAPPGQQLESSDEIETTVSQVDSVEMTAQIPAETPLAEPEMTVNDETEATIEELSEDEAPKKGFFSRLFGSKDENKTGESSVPEEITSEEIVEIEISEEEPVVIAKLEESEQVDPIEKEAEEAFMENLDTTPDVKNIGGASASDIQPLAVQGDPSAQFQLGTLYHQGKGVKQDYSQAFLWYRRAAQQGNSDAQYSLGNMYLMGEGIKQDDYQARQWYEKAAEQGHESAQHNLSSLQRIATAEPEVEPEYDSDNNNLPIQDDETLEEPEEKRGFFSKLFGKDDPDEEVLEESEISVEEIDELEISSEQLSADSSKTISDSASDIYEKGLAFEFGEGVPQSYSTAFELFNESAGRNYAPAQYKVGLAYAYGQGTEKDTVVAAEWYWKSAAQGYALAQRTLATLYMGGDGIEQNKPLALAWYDILADNGNVLDVHKRDALKEKLTSDEIDEAIKLKQELSN